MAFRCSQNVDLRVGVKKMKNELTCGSLPFGFQLMPDGIHLEPHPVEHPVLARILELRRNGMGGRRIAATLAIKGHQPRGAAWNHGNLQVMADKRLAQDVLGGCVNLMAPSQLR